MTPEEVFDDGPVPEEPAPPTPGVRRIEPAIPARSAANTRRELPASAEAEEHVIACCLIPDSDTLLRAQEAGITGESFHFPRNHLIWDALIRLEQPTLETLLVELGADLPKVGGLPYLMQVTGKIPTTAHAAYFIAKVRECELRRRVIREAQRTVEEAYTPGGLDEFLQIATSRMEAVRTGSSTAADRAKQAKAALDLRRVKAATPPTEPVTRLYLAKKPIATPGNLVTLISRAKTGKTAVLGAATAAIIAAHHDRPSQDTLGFTAPHTTDAVIVIDTEQSPYDAYLCYHRSLKRAGQETDPDWLYHYSLVGCTPEQIKDAILAALASVGPVFTLILDGVADLVNSVNDEAECNGLVVWLRGIAVQYNCPIICVIHSNESVQSGDDGRGHLGKQLIRKAESNLLLKKTGEVTTVTSDKQRKAPITEKDGIAFQWSDEAQMHVSVKSDAPTTAVKGGRTKEFQVERFISIFPRSPEKAMTRQALLRYAQEITEVSDTSFRRALNQGVQDGILLRIEKPTGYVYHLSSFWTPKEPPDSTPE